MKNILLLLLVITAGVIAGCDPHVDDMKPQPPPPPPSLDAGITVTTGTEDTVWYNESDTIAYKCSNTSGVTVNGTASDSAGTLILTNLKDSTKVTIVAKGKNGGKDATTTVYVRPMSQIYTTFAKRSCILTRWYDSASLTGNVWKGKEPENCYPDYAVAFKWNNWLYSSRRKECPGSDTILKAPFVFTYTPTEKSLMWGLVPYEIRALTADSLVIVKKSFFVNLQGQFEDGKVRLVFSYIN